VSTRHGVHFVLESPCQWWSQFRGGAGNKLEMPVCGLSHLSSLLSLQLKVSEGLREKRVF
jgi:hypothetical protein